MTRLLLGIALLAAGPSAGLRAQAPAPAFEVASIRAVTGGQGQSVMFLPTGRFTAQNLSLRDLIALAYGPGQQPLPAARVIGGPEWIASQRFNIEAVAGGPVALDPDGTPAAMFLMLRSLLADRFQLAIRKETFNANLEWNPDALSADSPAPASSASIFTAIQEQLGLRLESRRLPVEVVIVERAERPTAN